MYHRRFVPFAIAIFAAALTTGSGAHAADVIQFDPDGTATGSGTLDVSSFDFAPGNALAADTSGIGQSSVAFDQYAQSKLTAVRDADNNRITVPGLDEPGGFEITIMAKYRGTASEPIDDMFSLDFDGSPEFDNWVKLFFDDTPDADAKAGTGFGDGVEIFDGTVSDVFGVFSIDTSKGTPLLDQSADGDDLGGQKTEVGGGQVTVTINPSFLNSDFFKSSFIEAEFGAESITPFNNVNPSARFNDVPADSTITAVTPDLGELNTPNNLDDFQFQTDGNADFIIPEPSTLALVGLGGLALLRRRRA